jgi:2-O-methyltransferase
MRRPDMLLRKIRGKNLAEITADEIAPYLPADPVILEAGACDGTDTVKFAQRWPSAVIHAFEPVPYLNDEVNRRTSGLRGVRLYQLAISASPGVVVMHVIDPSGGGGQRGSSSLLQAVHDRVVHDIEVQTVTLEGWAEAAGVTGIDLMWLDLEGMELAALKTAGNLLKTVKAVCMEVSREQRYVGCPLYDEVVGWMKEQGFRPVIDRVTLWFGNILFVRD